MLNNNLEMSPDDLTAIKNRKIQTKKLIVLVFIVKCQRSPYLDALKLGLFLTGMSELKSTIMINNYNKRKLKLNSHS